MALPDLLVYQMTVGYQDASPLGHRYLTKGLGLSVMSCLTQVRQISAAAPPAAARRWVSTIFLRRHFAAGRDQGRRGP
jgi:hypothetical protein